MNETNETRSVPAETPGPERSLDDLELIISQGLVSYDEPAALALLEVHERKLYQKSHRTFRKYLTQRWHIGRSRGYQMLHFARLKKMSTVVGTGGPENERQARFLDAGGQTRHPKEADPTMRTMNYTATTYEKLPLPERLCFVRIMQSLLAEMEERVVKDLAALAGSPATFVNPSSSAGHDPTGDHPHQPL